MLYLTCEAHRLHYFNFSSLMVNRLFVLKVVLIHSVLTVKKIFKFVGQFIGCKVGKL